MRTTLPKLSAKCETKQDIITYCEVLSIVRKKQAKYKYRV